jgi:hypothetical protein
MKSLGSPQLLIVLALAGGIAAPAVAQNVLTQLESDIRQANPPTATTPPAGARVYLGAVANDDAGRGVRITTVRGGSPAERAGLQTQDLVIGVGGNRIRMLRELTTIIGRMKPGDRLTLDVRRGGQSVRVEVVLGAPPQSTAQPAPPPSLPPAVGQGTEPADTIPPPPGEVAAPPAPAEGPALAVPQPVAANGAQEQIDELRRRVDQLEQRVKELERALAESKK